MTHDEACKIAQDNHKFMTAILNVRDSLKPIVDGEIDRGHCVAGERECYGGRVGKRKTTLKDAVKIAKTAIFIIDKAANEFDRD